MTAVFMHTNQLFEVAPGVITEATNRTGKTSTYDNLWDLMLLIDSIRLFSFHLKKYIYCHFCGFIWIEQSDEGQLIISL